MKPSRYPLPGKVCGPDTHGIHWRYLSLTATRKHHRLYLISGAGGRQSNADILSNAVPKSVTERRGHEFTTSCPASVQGTAGGAGDSAAETAVTPRPTYGLLRPVKGPS